MRSGNREDVLIESGMTRLSFEGAQVQGREAIVQKLTVGPAKAFLANQNLYSCMDLYSVLRRSCSNSRALVCTRAPAGCLSRVRRCRVAMQSSPS